MDGWNLTGAYRTHPPCSLSVPTRPAVDQPAALKLFAGIRPDRVGAGDRALGIPIGNEPYGGFSGNGTCFSGFSINVRVCAMNILGLGIFPVRD